jgi:hypothetical protein
MSDFFGPLRGGLVRFPDAAINSMGPLPHIPGGAPQFSTADGQYNQHGLPINGLTPYAYGTSARISTQTQMAHPNRVALIIPKLHIPSPQADVATIGDPVLEHSVSDGDLVFSFRMSPDMTAYGSQYFVAPYGYASKAVPLINLATVNYILWGLQVGMQLPRHTHWTTFFSKLTRNHRSLNHVERLTKEQIWNFIRTYIRPFAIQHGGDMQGGRHEGDTDTIVTHGAVDYVSSFAIEGKLLHVNNIWRDFNVHEGDDLGLELTQMEAPHSDLFFDLSSSVRAHRTERVPVSHSFYYLRPFVVPFKLFSEQPYIHIGRSQKYCSLYSRGQDVCCWNARMGVIPGAPLQLTFEPGFVQSDDMFYDDLNFGSVEAPVAATQQQTEQQAAERVEEPPPSFHFPSDPLSKKRAVAAAAADIQLEFSVPDPATIASKPKKPKSVLMTTKPSASTTVTFAPDA